MEINNARQVDNTLTDKMDKIDRITIIEANIEADLYVVECSPTAGRLGMTKAVLELDKELNEQSLTPDIQKINQGIADVGHAPMKYHAYQDSAGQLQ